MNIKGFTLLEVTLFLAVSGALGLIAFIGLGPRLRNVKFTQSVRLVENTINSQFSAVASGQNYRPPGLKCENTAGGTNDLSINADVGSGGAGSSNACVINGKMVVFEADKMIFYSIVSRRQSNAASCSAAQTFAETKQCFNPRVIEDTPGPTFSGYEATYSSGVTARFPNPPAPSIRGYGYVQSPNGISKYPFFYTSTNSALASEPSLTDTNSSETGGPLKICLELSNRNAELTVKKDSIKPEISLQGCTI